MGDSDDEYERRRSRDGREKFRRERSDYERRNDDRRKENWDHGNRGGGRGRGDWAPRTDRGGRDPYGRDTRRREPYQQQDGGMPPQKRIRRDWEYDGGHRGYPMPYGAQPMHRAPAPWPHPHPQMPPPHPDPTQQNPERAEVDYPTQPLVMTFKQFLAQQEDNISDQDAIKKYNTYKTDFKKQQINQFFLAHKDNEWFKAKYHPDECVKKNATSKHALTNRVRLFSELFRSGQIDAVSVDTDKTDALVRLLDTVIIKLEGGSDFDLQALDAAEEDQLPAPGMAPHEPKPADAPAIIAPIASAEPDQNLFTLTASPVKKKRKRSGTNKKSEVPLNLESMTEEQIRLQKAAQEFSKRQAKAKRKEKREQAEKDGDYNYSSDSDSEDVSDSDDEPAPPEHEKVTKKKEKREQAEKDGDYNYSSDSDSEDVSDSDDEPAPPEHEKATKKKEKREQAEKDGDYNYSSDSDSEDVSDSDDEPAPPEHEATKKKEKREQAEKDGDYNYSSDSDSEDVSDSDDEPAPPGLDEDGAAAAAKENGEVQPEPVVPPPAPEVNHKEGNSEEKEKDTAILSPTPQEKPVPQALHKTQSIFLRNLAPNITKTEVMAICKKYPGLMRVSLLDPLPDINDISHKICKKYPGFMRVSLQDPLPDRNFFRRGWATYDRTVDILSICWNLNNIRVRECELSATLNRELKLRVRPITQMAGHKPIARQDIKFAAKIITNLDGKWKLWEPEHGVNEKGDSEKVDFGLVSRNPIMKNITQYLVDEGSFEEDELIGQTSVDQPKEASIDPTVDRDPTLLQVLDRLILYLRIVHSVDYYSAAEFPNEDEMPHRCGIMHARNITPPPRMTQTDVNDYMHNFESRIKHLVTMRDRLDDREIDELGRKDPDAEVEKFVTANTQELGKDKWLCPLSGKKFKGPEFVKKHILTKHLDKIDEVKKEVSYFNNYLMDPKRPQLPEHPGNRAPVAPPPQPHPTYPAPHYPGYPGYPPPRPPMMHGYGHHPPPYRGGYHGNRDVYRHDAPRRPPAPGRRTDSRPLIEYRDLDQPDDADIF